MTESMVAVAAIWVAAPAITQGQNASSVRGTPSPVANMTPARNNNANGKPNKKRTWAAPTVPSVAVSSRCMALRAVCAAAAISVKTAQSMVLRSGGGQFGGGGEFGHLAAFVVDQQK